MLEISKIKPGKKILHKERPCEVLKTTFSKIGRQGAVLRARIMDLTTGNVYEETFRDADKLEEVELEREKAQFLYRESDVFNFMNLKSYDQFSLNEEIIGSLRNYIIEGVEVEIIYYKGDPVNIELPIKMNFKVVDAPPFAKGNTVDGGSKKVKIETGFILDVPMFIKEGDIIKINTREGSYVERV